MKKHFLLILSIILFFSACIPEGTDTIILPEQTDSYLPEEIASEWKIAIKCKEQTEIAIETTLTTLTNSEEFIATGTASDYGGEPISFTVTGTYDKKLDVLSAEIRYDFTDDGTYRIDFFAINFNNYIAGTYIDLIKIDESNSGGPYPSCDTEIKMFY